MRFFIAVGFIAIYILVSLMAAQGIEGIGMLIGYLVGGAIIVPSAIAALFCLPKSGRNSKRFFGVFNFTLFLLIVGNVASLGKILDQSTQTLVATNGAIQVTVPSSWEIEDKPNDNILLNIKHRSGFLNIVITHEQVSGETPVLEQYAIALGERFEQNAPDFKSRSNLKECEETVFKCVYQIIETTTGDKGTTTVLASAIGRNGVYNYFATTNPGLLKAYQKEIFTVLRSLREIQA